MRCDALVSNVILAVLAIASSRAETITFEREVGGIPPSEFDAWGTGDAGPGLWAVVTDDSAQGGRAFEQYRREPVGDRVPLAIYKPFSDADLEVSIRFKPTSGRLDQAGGIAVRLTTPDDYYVARASALAQDVRLYHVANGAWGELARAHTRLAPEEGHTLVPKAEGDRFFVAPNGQPPLATADATFRAAGKVALWTKADSITRFEHLEIKSLP
jgi:hypothetical protein